MTSDNQTETRGGNEAVARHLRGSSLLFSGRLLAMLIALVTQWSIVRVLDKAEFGAFAFGLTLVASMRVVVSFGDSQSAGRFLTLDAEEQDRGAFEATLMMILARIVLVSVIVIGALVVLSGWITESFLSETSDATVIVVLLLLAPLEAFGAALGSVFAVFDQVRMVLLRKYLYAPLVRLAAVLFLVLAGAGARALAIGYVVGEVVGLALYAAVARKTVASLGPRPTKREPVWRRLKPYLAFSIPAGTVEMVTVVMITVTVMLLGWWHGPEAVAEFRAVFPFGQLNQMVLMTFSVLFAPLATRFFANNDRSGMEQAYWQTSAYLVVLSFPIFALSVPLAWKSVGILFGDQYQTSAPVLAVLGLAYFVHSGFGYNALVLQIHGHVRWVLAANVASMASSVLVGVLLIPIAGAIGVAWSVLAGLVVQNCANQLGLRRYLGFGVIDPILLRTIAVSTVLVAALFGLAAVDLPLSLLVVCAGLASLILIAATRASLQIVEVFPGIAKLPVIGRLAKR